MKLVTGLIILLFLNNCSFDSKSGIWKNEKQISSKKSDITENFETFESAKEKFNKIIIFNNNYSFKTSDLITNDRWLDIFFSDENNLKNFSYKSLNQPIFKSRKLTKFETSEYLLFEKNKIIISDKKGNIVVFSISENKVIFKFNFYKKKI